MKREAVRRDYVRDTRRSSSAFSFLKFYFLNGTFLLKRILILLWQRFILFADWKNRLQKFVLYGKLNKVSELTRIKSKDIWRIDRVAKEPDWKSGKAATPRGFESHVLRHRNIEKPTALAVGFCFITQNFMYREIL